MQEGITFALSKEQSLAQWSKQDTVWMLSLYGTAIGAGILFLPIDAGLHGIWPLIIMALLAFPMTYFSHQALCRFVLSGSKRDANITEVVDEHFGQWAGRILTVLYFFAIYPFLLMYSVAITNTTESFFTNQIGYFPLPRSGVALLLILSLMLIVRLGQEIIIKAMSILVYPFVIILMLLALYLIPHWNNAILQSGTNISDLASDSHFWKTIWLVIPVMVFSFNHSAIISSFAVSQKKQYGDTADDKSSLILRYSHGMMVLTVMFFVFSCVFSLSPADLHLAKNQNISILSYLANHFKTPVIAYIAPLIAFVAISKSFLGHYLGAKEGLQGLIIRSFERKNKQLSIGRLNLSIELFMVFTCWLAATLNPSILGMIETLGGPVIALILFIMPMYAIAKIPVLQKFTRPWVNAFITVMGLVAISAILYRLFV